LSLAATLLVLARLLAALLPRASSPNHAATVPALAAWRASKQRLLLEARSATQGRALVGWRAQASTAKAGGPPWSIIWPTYEAKWQGVHNVLLAQSCSQHAFCDLLLQASKCGAESSQRAQPATMQTNAKSHKSW